jgi:hypothetical protein
MLIVSGLIFICKGAVVVLRVGWSRFSLNLLAIFRHAIIYRLQKKIVIAMTIPRGDLFPLNSTVIYIDLYNKLTLRMSAKRIPLYRVYLTRICLTTGLYKLRSSRLTPTSKRFSNSLSLSLLF